MRVSPVKGGNNNIFISGSICFSYLFPKRHNFSKNIIALMGKKYYVFFIVSKICGNSSEHEQSAFANGAC